MAFTNEKDGSKGFVKRVASSFSMRKKKNATSEPKLLPRSKSTGSANFESMRLPATKKISDVTNKTRIKPLGGVAPAQPRREKIDDRGTNNKFGKWRSFDDSDSIWLSSDCASPTSLLEERRLSVSFRFSVDESVVSWLSNLAKTSLSLNHQEVSSIKDRPRIPRNTKENAENIQKKDSSRSVPNLTVVDSSTQSSQGKKVSFSKSSGTQLESGNHASSLIISSDVPSDLNNHTATSLVREICLDEKSAEIVDSKSSGSNVDEPLFWPYEQRFDWTPEDILKHFSMSPRRKKLLNAKVSAGSSPRSMRAQLLQARKLDLKDGSKRKLVFNGPLTNAAKIPELKRNNSNKKNDSIKNEPIRNCVKRNKSLPSRLRNSSKTCSKVVPFEVAEEVIAAERAKVEITARKLINRISKTMLEDDFSLMNDFSIENAVGLGEFKGREGIDSEFNSDIFLFDDSL